jgi:outer membrane protein assembly factor BamB
LHLLFNPDEFSGCPWSFAVVSRPFADIPVIPLFEDGTAAPRGTNMTRAKLTLAFSLVASAALAQPQPAARLAGWWRATLSHAGETRDVYLHFVEKEGRLGVKFSIPEIGAEDAPLSWVKDNGDTVEMSSVGWTLKRGDGGRELTGTIPADLVPHYRLPARFIRVAGAPSPLPAVAGKRPAPAPRWQASVGAPVYGGLAFDARRNHLLIGTTAGNVVALRSNDGSTAWSINAGAPVRSTPTVAGGYVYVPSDTGLLKLDARTGRSVWRAAFGQPRQKQLDVNDPNSRWDVYSSAAVAVGNRVYVGSRDGCVHVLRASDGGQLRGACSTDIVTATPVLDRGRLVFGSFDGKVYAVDSTSGRKLWTQDTHGAVTSDLAIFGGHVLAGSRSYDFSALDLRTGRPAWTRYFWFSWVEAAPSVVGSTIYIGSSDSLRVRALDGRNGAVRWAARLPGWAWPKPAVGGQTVYAAYVGTRQPYIGPRDGGFAALDRATGEVKWLYPAPSVEGAKFYGFASAPVRGKGMVYAADLEGRVLAFRDQ